MDSEMQEVTKLLSFLETVVLDTGTDKLVWRTDTSDNFTVKKIYKQLLSQTSYQGSGLPRKLIWDAHIPTRLNIFLQEIEHQAGQTKKKLQNIFPDQNSVCVLCSKRKESLERLFFSCEFTHKIWATLAQAMGYNYQHNSFKIKLKDWSVHTRNQEVVDWFQKKAPIAIWVVSLASDK